jgi:hypothetical protein
MISTSILFAKDGNVGTDLIEQFGNDCRHAFEMARPGSPAPEFAKVRDLDARCKTIWVDFRHRRHPKCRHACFGKVRGIGLFRSRIYVQVLIGPELFGVHENRHNHIVGLPPRQLDQGHVSGMQSAHCRHKRKGPPALAYQFGAFAQGGKLTDDLHGQACSDMDGRALLGGREPMNQEAGP